MTKCIEHLFREINEEELNIIKNLRKDIEITTIKVKNFGEGEEGKMIIVDLYWTWMRERIFYIKPLFNEETFKYINPDNYEEENKEKEKMIEKGKEKEGKQIETENKKRRLFY